MKLFKKIPIEGYEEYEINEDGYVLHLKSGNLMKLDNYHMIPSTKGGTLSVMYIINRTFKNKEE